MRRGRANRPSACIEVFALNRATVWQPRVAEGADRFPYSAEYRRGEWADDDRLRRIFADLIDLVEDVVCHLVRKLLVERTPLVEGKETGAGVVFMPVSRGKLDGRLRRQVGGGNEDLQERVRPEEAKAIVLLDPFDKLEVIVGGHGDLLGEPIPFEGKSSIVSTGLDKPEAHFDLEIVVLIVVVIGSSCERRHPALKSL